MREVIHLPAGRCGRAWEHRSHGGPGRFMHRHNELEVNLATAGSATYLVGEQRFDLRPGTQIWLFPEQEHLLIDQSPDYAMWLAVFKPGPLRNWCKQRSQALLRRLDPGQVYCRQLPLADQQHLGEFYKELCANTADVDRYNAGLGYLLLLSWAAHQKAPELAVASNVHPAVEKAARLLRDHPDTLSLHQLARSCHVSSSHLSRLFHRQTGVTLVDYRNRQRVTRFLALMNNQPHPKMMHTALAAGFGSYARFHRVFKQVMGINPAGYRRQIGSQ